MDALASLQRGRHQSKGSGIGQDFVSIVDRTIPSNIIRYHHLHFGRKDLTETIILFRDQFHPSRVTSAKPSGSGRHEIAVAT